MARDGHDETAGSEVDRRAFLKKMAAIAFVAPVISSFTLDAAASADPDKRRGRDQHASNVYHPNQHLHFPNQYHPNQHLSNMFHPNMFHKNMFHPNMFHPNMLSS